MDDEVKLWNPWVTRTSANLRMAFQGRHNRVQIGKDVLRVIGAPNYITIRVNKNMDSLVVEAAQEKHKLSFKVPDGIMFSHHLQMFLNSESFVHGIMIHNELDLNETYEVPGIYSEKNNAVVFNLADSVLLSEYKKANEMTGELSAM